MVCSFMAMITPECPVLNNFVEMYQVSNSVHTLTKIVFLFFNSIYTSVSLWFCEALLNHLCFFV
jgi:hypothetical protein